MPYISFCFEAKLKTHLFAKTIIIATVAATKTGHVTYFGEDSISSMYRPYLA
jgi:hypothetical protein